MEVKVKGRFQAEDEMSGWNRQTGEKSEESGDRLMVREVVVCVRACWGWKEFVI